MKIFVDSAKFDEIEKADNSGILDGVTTNPSLLKKAVDDLKKKGEKINLETYIKKILKKLGPNRPVSLEVVGTSYEQIVSEGIAIYRKFNGVSKNVYVKVPINPSMKKGDDWSLGIRAIQTLSKRGIPINCTLIFTPEQALAAAKAGAVLVSPFAGRIDDLLRNNSKVKFDKKDYFPAEGIEKGGKEIEDNGIISGVDLVSQIVEIFETYGIQTEVLAASIRNSQQLRECALVGADIVTAPLSVIESMLEHEKTVEGMKAFTRDVVKEYSDLIGGNK